MDIFSYNKNQECICHCIRTLALEQSSKINKMVIIRLMALGSLCWEWKDALVAFSWEQKWTLFFLCFLPQLLWFITEAIFHPVSLRWLFFLVPSGSHCCFMVPSIATHVRLWGGRTSKCFYYLARALSDTCNGLVRIGRWTKCHLNSFSVSVFNY